MWMGLASVLILTGIGALACVSINFIDHDNFSIATLIEFVHD